MSNFETTYLPPLVYVDIEWPLSIKLTFESTYFVLYNSTTVLTAPKNNRGQWSETRPIIMYIPRAQRTVLRQINKSISGILPSQSVLREITSKKGIHNWHFTTVYIKKIEMIHR